VLGYYQDDNIIPSHPLRDVLPIPKGNGKTEVLKKIGDTRESIFSPFIPPAMSMIIGEIIPRIPIRAIIFSHCSPLPFAQVWAPLLEWYFFKRIYD
jgi:hypothetical protein